MPNNTIQRFPFILGMIIKLSPNIYVTRISFQISYDLRSDCFLLFISQAIFNKNFKFDKLLHYYNIIWRNLGNAPLFMNFKILFGHTSNLETLQYQGFPNEENFPKFYGKVVIDDVTQSILSPSSLNPWLELSAVQGNF